MSVGDQKNALSKKELRKLQRETEKLSVVDSERPTKVYCCIIVS